MSPNLIATLRFLTSAAAVLITLTPVTVSAYTSTGADGLFQPTTSVVLNNSTQSIFNFTDIYIPSGVTLSFSDMASTQPIELLATGNIDIAGSLNFGSSNVWIETPGSISVEGSIFGSNGTITLAANTITASGTINVSNGSLNLGINGGNTSLFSSGSSGSGSSSATLSSCSSISNICSVLSSVSIGTNQLLIGSNNPVAIGTIPILNGVIGSSNPIVAGSLTGTGSITVGVGTVNVVGPTLTVGSVITPVPEPGEWAMLLLGLFALFAVPQIRKQSGRLG